MRIRSVSMEGFGPFKQKQSIDFTAFDADGLFLIAGETGVGKSSILDAIAYALYNRTPRWDNVTGTGASNAVRSDFCGLNDVTEVIVRFETNGEEYRVTRSPEYERPKMSGGGTTRQNAKVLLEALDGDRWVGRATREREAAEAIETLLKLTRDEFLQVMMLAQGRFQEFLLADSTQRLDVLSKLFGTDRFADYQNRVAQRRADLSRQLESARAELGALLRNVDAPEEVGTAAPGTELAWLDEVIAHARSEQLGANRSAKTAATAEKSALGRLDLARKQERRDAAVAALSALTARNEEIEQTRLRLHRAERAERIRPVLETAAEQEQAVVHLATLIDDARRDYSGQVGDAELDAEVERLTQQIGAVSSELEEEDRASQLTAAVAATETAAQDLAGKAASAGAALAGLRDERERLAPLAARFPSAQEAVDRSRGRLAAATEAAQVTELLRSALERLLAADQRLTAARAHADDTLARFLHGQAGVLATLLVEGEPCSVCGSTEHPAPAQVGDDPVSQEVVDSAQSVVVGLEPAAQAARQGVEELKVRAAQLQGAAGDDPIDVLAASVTQAEAELSATDGAMARIAIIDGSLQGDDGLVSAHDRLVAEHALAAAESTRLAAEADAITQRLTRLRGDHASVRARHTSLVLECDTAKILATRLAAQTEAVKQRDAANDRLAAKLVGENFDSADQVSGALLAETEADDLREQLTAHAAAISEHQGILKQPDLQGLPDDTIAIAEAEAAHLAAQELVRVASRDAARAEEAVARLGTQRTQLAGILTATEGLADRFNVLHRLAETVNGRSPNIKSMTLESYYIAAELEDVLDAANGRLAILSSGRFEFRHTERGVRRANAAAGLEIEVFDQYTGTARPAHQLSGGEQFLASLALALGLAEVVTSRAGGIELNTLFIDEGFGSLSAEYLEIAMETLDSLKQGGRTVGVISHVVSMQERIGAQLQVHAEPGGPSTIVQEGVIRDETPDELAVVA